MKILSNVTLDNQYIHERQNRMNRALKNIKEALYFGFKNFFNILMESILGIIKIPYRETKKHGLIGLIIGIYSGIISLIIKPTVGIFDLIINIFEGIINEAVYQDHIMDTRYRPPRIFGPNDTLVAYEYVKSLGIEIIKRYKIKEINIESVAFFDEIEIPPKQLIVNVVLTNFRIIYVYVWF